jgi:hypothetical protein
MPLFIVSAAEIAISERRERDLNRDSISALRMATLIYRLSAYFWSESQLFYDLGLLVIEMPYVSFPARWVFGSERTLRESARIKTMTGVW